MLKKKKVPQRSSWGKRFSSSNLYTFVRLVLGPYVSDRQIAQRWEMDEKNFHDFKTDKYPVLKMTRLESLAVILGINKHLVFQVAGGTPARKVFELIKKNDSWGQIRLLSTQLDDAQEALLKSEQRYQQLFNNACDAIIIADIKTHKILDVNSETEILTGLTRRELIGMDREYLHPPLKKSFYKKQFKYHTQHQKIQDSRRAEVIHKDGTIIPVNISASVMELDGRKVIQGIFRRII
jgi:PAS domain S-box-containing protein